MTKLTTSSNAWAETGGRPRSHRCRCGGLATRRCDWAAESSGEMRCTMLICDLCPKHAGLHRDAPNLEGGKPRP